MQERLTEVAAKVISRRERVIGNEAATKESLIKPFFEALGWDTTDPDTWSPEYDADFNGRKKGEKVDYAIVKDGIPAILIEAKPYQKDERGLISRDGQLARYFNATVSAKVSVITNGIIYRFFTDTVQENIQDQDPFMIVDLANLSSEMSVFLEMMSPQVFVGETVREWAKRQQHDNKVRDFLRSILLQPGSNVEFARLVLSNTREGSISKSALEQFGPKLTQLMTQTMNGILEENFKRTIAGEGGAGSVAQGSPSPNTVETTVEELNLFHAIRGMLAGSGRDAAGLVYKDFPRWFNISQKKAGNWFARFYSAERTLLLKAPHSELASACNLESFSAVPKGQNTMFKLGDQDIFTLQPAILKAFDYVLEGKASSDEQENNEDSMMNQSNTLEVA
jgi:hypothetical protein